jgi:hypothetical protein
MMGFASLYPSYGPRGAFVSFVAWAKARLRRAHHFSKSAILNGGHVAALLCPPYGLYAHSSARKKLLRQAEGEPVERQIIDRAVILGGKGFAQMVERVADRGFV